VRVLTVNIWARNGLYPTRERLLRQSVGVLAPDLLALQEVDAGSGNSNGSPGYTWSSDNPNVAPFAAAVLGQPVHHRRIDYLLVGSPFRWWPRIVVRSCRVVLTEAGSDAPSDHYGVLADLAPNGVVIGGGEGLKAWTAAAAALWPGGDQR